MQPQRDFRMLFVLYQQVTVPARVPLHATGLTFAHRYAVCHGNSLADTGNGTLGGLKYINKNTNNQTHAAQLLGVSQPRISDLINGKMKKFLFLVNYLGVTFVKELSLKTIMNSFYEVFQVLLSNLTLF